MSVHTFSPRTRQIPVGRILRSLAAAKRPRLGEFAVTAWSEACACGGNLLGQVEEPCREDCTGYYPARGYYVFGHGRRPAVPALPPPAPAAPSSPRNFAAAC